MPFIKDGQTTPSGTPTGWRSNGFQLDGSGSYYGTVLPAGWKTGDAPATTEIVYTLDESTDLTSGTNGLVFFSAGRAPNGTGGHELGFQYWSGNFISPYVAGFNNGPVISSNNLATANTVHSVQSLYAGGAMTNPNPVWNGNTLTSGFAYFHNGSTAANVYITNPTPQAPDLDTIATTAVPEVLSIGGRSGESFTPTQYDDSNIIINSVRVYSRALTKDEVAQNAAIDQGRFFTPLTIKLNNTDECTNLIITSTTQMRCQMPSKATAGTYNITYDFNGSSNVDTGLDFKYVDNAHTVTFNGNGGTPPIFTQYVVDGEWMENPTVQPVLTSRTFGGWYSTQTAAGSSCSGTKYADSSSNPVKTADTKITGDITLYACWPPPGNTVTYSMGSQPGVAALATAPSSVFVAQGSNTSAVTLTSGQIPANYKFTGWCTGTPTTSTSTGQTTANNSSIATSVCPSGSTTYAAAATITPTADMTLTAMWERLAIDYVPSLQFIPQGTTADACKTTVTPSTTDRFQYLCLSVSTDPTSTTPSPDTDADYDYITPGDATLALKTTGLNDDTVVDNGNTGTPQTCSSSAQAQDDSEGGGGLAANTGWVRQSENTWTCIITLTSPLTDPGGTGTTPIPSTFTSSVTPSALLKIAAVSDAFSAYGGTSGTSQTLTVDKADSSATIQLISGETDPSSCSVSISSQCDILAVNVQINPSSVFYPTSNVSIKLYNGAND
jgi:hypothetical protein